MIAKQRKSVAAFSLAEVMLAVAIVVIAALGALGYQYHGAIQAHIAKCHTTATHTAQLLLEDWKSTGGSEDYNPTTLGLGFSAATPPSTPSADVQTGTLVHGAVYTTTVDDIPMQIWLRWQDVAYDSTAEVTLRQLKVIVRFGEISEPDDVYSDGDEQNRYEGSRLRDMPAIILTTYVRLDSAGG